MNQPSKRRTFAEWLRDTLVIYIVPFGIVAYIKTTQCWPYFAIKDFFKTGVGNQEAWIEDDVIYVLGFLIVAAVFYALQYLCRNLIKIKL